METGRAACGVAGAHQRLRLGAADSLLLSIHRWASRVIATQRYLSRTLLAPSDTVMRKKVKLGRGLADEHLP